MTLSHRIEVIDDDDEEERTVEENLFLIAAATKRPYEDVLKEHKEREEYIEFWDDPCWANDNDN